MTEQTKSRNSTHFKNHTLQEEPEITPTATWFHAFLLGVAMKLSGCTSGWNYGLTVGFREYLISILIMGMAYLCLGLCMAEMISIMSFAGGYYGYARCAIGPFAGYIVGCCGVFESTFSMALSVLKIGLFITDFFETSRDLEPVWWMLTFIFVISCHYFGRTWFWQWIVFVAVSGLLLVFVYLFGTMSDLDFERYANAYKPENSALDFFGVFRLAVVFYLGFDMLTMTSAEVINPKVGVPRAMITLIGFLLVFAVWVMLTVTSQEPGISKKLYASSTLFPFVYGYQRMFGLEKRLAMCICVIPTFATPLGYMFVVGKQVNSMAKSGLLPAIFKHTVGDTRTPIMGMVYVVGLAMMGLFYAWAINPYKTMSRFATLAGCIVYIAMFTCYIIFNTRFSNLERSFRNPLGVKSAVVGILIFSVILTIMIFIDTDYYLITSLFFGYLGLMTVYYYAYAETHQFFSASEQKVFFKAYIVNMKRRKKQSMFQRIWADFIRMFRFVGIHGGSSRSKVYASSSIGDSELASNSRVSDNLSDENGSSHHNQLSKSFNPNTPATTLTNNNLAQTSGVGGFLLRGSLKSSLRALMPITLGDEEVGGVAHGGDKKGAHEDEDEDDEEEEKEDEEGKDVPVTQSANVDDLEAPTGDQLVPVTSHPTVEKL